MALMQCWMVGLADDRLFGSQCKSPFRVWLPVSRVMGFVTCGMFSVRDRDDKRAKSRTKFVLVDGITD